MNYLVGKTFAELEYRVSDKSVTDEDVCCSERYFSRFDISAEVEFAVFKQLVCFLEHRSALFFLCAYVYESY